MKKQILAGVLAGVTALSTSAAAFATAPTDKEKKDITALTETKYSVAVGFLDVKLDVTIPTKMVAFLNPYSAAVKVDNATTPTTANDGVVSWNYEIKNRTADYGINVDIIGANAKVTKGLSMATASDLPGAGEVMVGAADNKKVFLALLASKPGDPTSFLTVDDNLVNTQGNAVGSTPAEGAYIFKTIDAKTGEDFTKFAYVPNSADGTEQVTAIAFRGNLSQNTAADGSGTDLTWTKSDKVTATFSLKFAPSSAGTGSGGGGGSSWTASNGITAQPTGTGMTFTWVSGNTYNVDVPDSTSNVTPNWGFDTGWTITSAVANPATGVLTVRNSDGRITAAGNAGDTCTVTVTAEDDANPGTTATITLNVTLT